VFFSEYSVEGMCLISDQLLLTTNPSSTSKPAVNSIEINKQKLWDQLDEVYLCT